MGEGEGTPAAFSVEVVDAAQHGLDESQAPGSIRVMLSSIQPLRAAAGQFRVEPPPSVPAWRAVSAGQYFPVAAVAAAFYPSFH